MSADDPRPPPIHLARRGTFIAKSSEYTRASAILHSNDIDIGVEGKHDRGSTTAESTGGVGFVSVQSRLDRIFQRDLDASNPSAPPPPPVPPVRIASHLSSAASTGSSPISTAPARIITTSSVSSEGSSSPDNGLHHVSAPPPLQGMLARSETRHRKLIKTRLADLPQELREQEPLIRGGVAVYKVTNPDHQEEYGKIVEINALDYIEKLRSTINDLETSLSIMTTKLEKHGLNKTQNVRPSIRMGTFMNKRTKEILDDVPSHKNAKGVPRAKTVVNVRRGANSANVQTSSVGGAPTTSGATPTNASTAPPKAQASVSFPTGYGCEDVTIKKNSGSKQPSKAAPLKPAVAKVTIPSAYGGQESIRVPQKAQVNIPAAFGGQAAVRSAPRKEPADVPNGNTGRRSSSHGQSQSTPQNARREKSRLANGDSRPSVSSRAQASVGIGSNGHPLSAVSQNPVPSVSIRKEVADRNAAPMPGVNRRGANVGAVGRTRSFSGMIGDTFGRKTLQVDHASDKPTRTFSMHRESISSPPPAVVETEKSTPKKAKGMRRFLGRRNERQ